MNPKVFSALFGNPAIYVEVPEDLPVEMLRDIESKLPVCSYLHQTDTVLMSIALPTDCENEVRRKLWRYLFSVEVKTTEGGEKNLCFRVVRRKKFFFF